MKGLIKLLLLTFLTPLAALAQNGTTTVQAIVKDPTGALYVSSQVGASFFDPGTSGKLPLLNGSTFQKSFTGYGTDSFGFFTLTLPDNGIIDSSSGTIGTQWNFTICYKDRQTCFTYKTPINCASNIPVTCTNNLMDLSTPLQAVAALLPSAGGGGSPAQGALYTVQASNGAGQFQVTHIISNTNTNVTTINDSLNLPIGGTLNGTFAGSPLFSVTGNEALKPSGSSSIQYVSQSGNDSNDGLSWGTAKLTIYKALQSLPGGGTLNAGSGTILIDGTVNVGGPASNQGIWLMGGTDPNFGSPPSGWLKYSGATGIVIEGVIRNTVAAHGHEVLSTILGGGATDSVHPAIWISGINQPVAFKNIYLGGSLNVYLKLGIDSNNNRTTAGGGVSGLSFQGIGWNHGACRVGGGPGMDIGSNSFWIYIKDSVGSGCVKQIFTITGIGASRTANVSTITTAIAHNILPGDTITIRNVTDPTFNGSFIVSTAGSTTFTYPNFGPNSSSGTGQVITAGASAINLDSGSGGGSGLTFIENFNENNGGIRMTPGVNGSGLYIRNVSYEGDFSDPDMPAVLVTSMTGASIVRVENVETSDNITPVVGLQVDVTLGTAGATADNVVASKVQNGVSGPAVLLGSIAGGVSPIPTRTGQYGLVGGRIFGAVDVARRNFSPSAVVSGVNLASSLPPGWAFTVGSGTITGGMTGPDGTSNAGRVTSSAGISFVSFYINNNTPISIGDSYVYGVWARSVNGNGYVNAAPPVKFVLNNNGFGAGDTCVSTATGQAQFIAGALPSYGDGEWAWFSGLCTVGSNPVNAGLILAGSVSTSITMDFYAPTLMKFVSGAKSLNEIAEIAGNFSSFPDNIAISGAVGMLRGQTFVMGTGANFLYTMAGNPTVDRTITWQDASGIPALKDVVETFTAKQTFSSAISTTFEDFPVQATPGNPSAGNIRVYGDSGSGNLTCLTSAGANCLPTGGGGGTPGGSTTQVQINIAGVFAGSPCLTWVSPALSLGVAGTCTGILNLAGTTSGVVSIQTQAAAGTYNFNLPTSAGTVGQPLQSGGGAGAPMTFGTLTVPGGGTGAVTFTANALLAGNGASAFQSVVGSTIAASPILTLKSPTAAGIALTLDTAATPSGDILRIQVNTVKTSWFDFNGFLNTPQTTYTGAGALTLSGTLASCPGTLAGTAILCLGDVGTGMALLANNGASFKPIAQLVNATPIAHSVAMSGTTTPQLESSASAGISGQAFLSGGPAAAGNYGIFNLAGGVNILSGVLPAINGGTGASSLSGANIITVTGAITIGHCSQFQAATVITDSGGVCGGAGGAPTLNSITAASASNTPINSASFSIGLNWTLTGSTVALKVGEAGAATGAGNTLFQVSTLNTSTATVVQFDNNGNGVKMSSTGALAPFGTGTNSANILNSLLSVNGITTAGVGVPFILGTPSNVTAQSTSQGSVTLATAPAAAPYAIVYYASQNAVCTTGANSVAFTFNWTDAGNARTLNTGNLVLGTAQAVSGYLSGSIPIFNNSGNVTYTSTVSGACASGTSSYDIHASIVRVQ